MHHLHVYVTRSHLELTTCDWNEFYKQGMCVPVEEP